MVFTLKCLQNKHVYIKSKRRKNEKTIKLKSLISCIAIIFREKPFLASLEGLSYLGSAITTGFMPLVWAFVFQAIENYITGKKEIRKTPSKGAGALS